MDHPLLSQAEAIRQQRILARRKRYSPGRLEPFRSELLMLANAGYSHRDLARWLRTYKRTKVAHTTVGRALKRWQHAAAVAFR